MAVEDGFGDGLSIGFNGFGFGGDFRIGLGCGFGVGAGKMGRGKAVVTGELRLKEDGLSKTGSRGVVG